MEMYIVMKRALFVEMTMMKSILATSVSTLGVMTSPSELILSPPIVNRVRLGSAITSRTVHTNCLCVTSRFRSSSTSCW